MIAAADFVKGLADAGFGLFSGVPCSYLTPLINEVIDSPDARYVNAVNEGDAVAVAAGAWLGGTHGVVMFQNSGFGNAVNPLSSLVATFRIPLLVITTWRGRPGGPADEPQHELMGRITPDLFDLLEIEHDLVPEDPRALSAVLTRAVDRIRSAERPYGLILPKGVVEGQPLRSGPDLASNPHLAKPPPPRDAAGRFDPDRVLARVRDAAGGRCPLVATTGFTGRALYALGDQPNQFYMAGSMGCAVGLGLGLAATRPDHRVIVLDGDGALLMRLGSLAMVAGEQPDNLVHVVLDNAAHDSTGAQSTLSPRVDLAAVALACGYRNAWRIERLDQIDEHLAAGATGATFLHVRTDPRPDRKLPRPSVAPPQVARRLQKWLGINTCVNQTIASA